MTLTPMTDERAPTADAAQPTPDPGRMPALYLGHGAPPLLDDPQWMGELAGWAQALPKPKSILIVSAHWQTAPMAISRGIIRAALVRIIVLLHSR